MSRLTCALIGYVCGNFLTAEVVSRRASGDSIFNRGTGNPGLANVVSQYGVKYGAWVLAGDLLKTFIPCLLCRWIFFPRLGVKAAARTAEYSNRNGAEEGSAEKAETGFKC